jgi:hypothetical protein
MFLTRSERYEYRLYRKNRRRRKLALVLAVALVLTAAALAHHGPAHASHLRDKATAPPTRTAAKTPSTRAPATADASADLKWIDFHGIELPVSAHDGPHHISSGLAWGFSDTPRGALLAAVNIAVRTAAQWGPAIYQPTIRSQVTGPDASTLLRADASNYAALRAAAHVRPGQPAGRGYASEAAYQFAAYTPGSATVDIVTEGPGADGTTVLTVTRIQVNWLRGDWRVVAPPDGNWASSATTASSLTGYTTFSDER